MALVKVYLDHFIKLMKKKYIEQNLVKLCYIDLILVLQYILKQIHVRLAVDAGGTGFLVGDDEDEARPGHSVSAAGQYRGADRRLSLPPTDGGVIRAQHASGEKHL